MQSENRWPQVALFGLSDLGKTITGTENEGFHYAGCAGGCWRREDGDTEAGTEGESSAGCLFH